MDLRVLMEGEWDANDPVSEARWVHTLAQREGTPHARAAQIWLDRDDVTYAVHTYCWRPMASNAASLPATFRLIHSWSALRPFTAASNNSLVTFHLKLAWRSSVTTRPACIAFGVLFIMNNAIGLLTPPVGTVLNVVAGAGREDLGRVTKGVWPFLVA